MSPNLPTTADITVRRGYTPHFDLRITPDSVAGRAISKEFGLVPCENGDKKRLKLLVDERASQEGEFVTCSCSGVP